MARSQRPRRSPATSPCRLSRSWTRLATHHPSLCRGAGGSVSARAPAYLNPGLRDVWGASGCGQVRVRSSRGCPGLSGCARGSSPARNKDRSREARRGALRSLSARTSEADRGDAATNRYRASLPDAARPALARAQLLWTGRIPTGSLSLTARRGSPPVNECRHPLAQPVGAIPRSGRRTETTSKTSTRGSPSTR
jgi:hypothetical protein